MEMYACYESPLKYRAEDTYVDSYGVDHSNFTTRDEIEYQLYRQEEENRRINIYDKLGLKGNYPQLGEKFWGNPENNYGFGSSNIHNRIEDLKNKQQLGSFLQFEKNFETDKMLDVAAEGLKGFGLGVETGLLRAANAMSRGKLDTFSKKYLDNIYERKQKELDDLIYGYNSPTVNNLYKGSKYLIEKSAGNIPVSGLYKYFKYAK